MQRYRRHNAQPLEDEPTIYNLDMYRSIFGSSTIEDPRTWIRQGYVEDTDAASTLSDAIDQLSPYDWPDDAPDTIELVGYGTFLDLSREDHYEVYPRMTNYRQDGGAHPTANSNDLSYLTDYPNLRPSHSLFRREPYREWYRIHVFEHWLTERPRMHSVQLMLTDLIDMWYRYRHHDAHNCNFNPLNNNESNLASSSSDDSDEPPNWEHGGQDITIEYPSTVLTPPSTPRSGSSSEIDMTLYDYIADDSEATHTIDMTPPPSPIPDIGGDA